MITNSDRGVSGPEGAVVGAGVVAAEIVPYPFPVVVEVRGVSGPARFARLPDALAALLASLRALPLSAEQREYFDELFGPSGVQRIGDRLATFGEVRSLAFLGITPYLIKLCPVDPGVSR
ncbi:hypothetical protein [Kitasatospora aureofaciens]|uniref:hypothetical protein n=1 Tax=Kitasatospora aureofaciens TaxID=1894 RepID=UPI00382AFB4E